MNKIMSLVVAGLIFIGAPAFAGNIETHYTRIAEVVSAKGSSITVLDNSDHYWTFEGDGYAEGDKVSLKMFTNYTDDNIYDDEIISVKTLDR